MKRHRAALSDKKLGRWLVPGLLIGASIPATWLVTRSKCGKNIRVPLSSSEGPPHLQVPIDKRWLSGIAADLTAFKATGEAKPGPVLDAPYTESPGSETTMPHHSGVHEVHDRSTKVLKSREDEERIRELLRDRSVLLGAKRIMEHDGAIAYQEAGIVARAYQIEIFRAALEDDDNPAKAEIAQMLANLVIRPSNPKKLTDESRLSVAGDRIVLYQMLDRYFPAAADDLLASIPRGRLHDLMEYAKTVPLAVRRTQ